MNNRLYGNLIFELSKEGRRGYSLPQNKYAHKLSELPASLCRQEQPQLPECDEMTVVVTIPTSRRIILAWTMGSIRWALAP